MSWGVFKATLLSVATAGLLAACASTPAATIGSKPADVPPRLVATQDGSGRTWDSPGAFGPVPAELAVKGQTVCSSLDTKDVKFKALGYHPAAKDFEGRAIPGGGFFCVVK